MRVAVVTVALSGDTLYFGCISGVNNGGAVLVGCETYLVINVLRGRAVVDNTLEAVQVAVEKVATCEDRVG